MPKAGSVWLKSFTDKEGNPAIRHSGKLVIEGVEYYADMYPKSSSNPNGPTFDVYLKPVVKEEIPF